MDDHVRGTILLKDWSQARDVLTKLREHFSDSWLESWLDAPQNRFGYRGIHFKARLGKGLGAEVQLHTRESWAAKRRADAIYRRWRNVNRDNMTSSQVAEYRRDRARSRAIFGSYWGSGTPTVSSRASSSVMGLAFITRSSLPRYGAQTPSSKTSMSLPEPSPLSSNTRPSSSRENPESGVPGGIGRPLKSSGYTRGQDLGIEPPASTVNESRNRVKHPENVALKRLERGTALYLAGDRTFGAWRRRMREEFPSVGTAVLLWLWTRIRNRRTTPRK
jgi:hypothetical protein